MSSRHVFETSSRHVFKTSSRNVFKTSWGHLHCNNFPSSKTSSRCLRRQKVVTLKTCWRRLKDIIKTNKCLLGCFCYQFWKVWLRTLHYFTLIFYCGNIWHHKFVVLCYAPKKMLCSLRLWNPIIATGKLHLACAIPIVHAVHKNLIHSIFQLAMLLFSKQVLWQNIIQHLSQYHHYLAHT